MQGNDDFVVVYEKLTLPETMLLLIRRRWIINNSGNDARLVGVLDPCERPVQSWKPFFVT